MGGGRGMTGFEGGVGGRRRKRKREGGGSWREERIGGGCKGRKGVGGRTEVNKEGGRWGGAGHRREA